MKREVLSDPPLRETVLKVIILSKSSAREVDSLPSMALLRWRAWRQIREVKPPHGQY